jgi:endo-1,4-beta-mannosidase
MSQKYKDKESNKIHRKKPSKIQNNRKIEKSLQVAQKRGIEILQVPNPADPLKSSNGEKSVKAGFVLLRLLAPEAGNHGLKNLQPLVFAWPEPGYPQIDIL